MEITYEDENGYLRNKDTNRLIHRQVAWKYLYHYPEYPQRFRNYDVHHIDRNKKNNNQHNLQIVTREEHKAIHEIPETKIQYQPSYPQYTYNPRPLLTIKDIIRTILLAMGVVAFIFFVSL